MRDRLQDNIPDWPTPGYVHGAINILERLYYADGDPRAVPPDCYVRPWRLPPCLYSVMSHWTIGNQHRLAVLGFGQEPAVTMLGWLLALARLGDRKLTSLDLAERDWPRLTIACGRLARCKILVEPGKLQDAGAFYELSQRLTGDRKVTRFLVNDLCLKNGALLSKLPIPSRWRTLSQMLGTKLLILRQERTPNQVRNINSARYRRR